MAKGLRMHRLLKVTLHRSRREALNPLIVGRREELAALPDRRSEVAVSIWLERTPNPRRGLDPQGYWVPTSGETAGVSWLKRFTHLPSR